MSDVFEKIDRLSISSCTCLTKTPDTYYHKEDCGYRILREIHDDVKRIFFYNGELCKILARNNITPPGWTREDYSNPDQRDEQ